MEIYEKSFYALTVIDHAIRKAEICWSDVLGEW